MPEDAQNQPGEGMQELMAKLPAHIRDFIYSPEMEAIIATIGKKNALHIDQIGALEAEAAAAMAGLTKTEELAENIEQGLQLDASKAAAVTKDINEMLFTKIRNDMKASSEPKVTPEPAKMPLAAQIPATAPSFAPKVVMPSSITPATATPTPSVVAPAAPIVPAAPTPTPQQPAPAPNLAHADAILSEKKATPPATAPVSAAAPAPAATPAPKTDPALPQNYKADPYREPVE